MRKVVAGLFISLDGVVESPDKWSFDHFDEGMMIEMQSQLDAQDTILLGRVTYQEWASYWPTSTDEPFASYINNIPKYVVSSTLEKATWNNSTLISENLEEEIGKLKQQSGKHIGISGSPSLVRSLLQNGLLDQLSLSIHPVIAGTGQRLFQDFDSIKRLRLVDSKTTETGVVNCTFQPR